jgi:hypothetical protein
MARLGRMLRNLDRKRTPVHVTPVARDMIEGMAAALPGSKGFVLRRLLDPRTCDGALRLLGERGRLFEGALRNTANATIVRGGSAVNVIPSEIEVEIDGRLLPGFAPDDLIGELRAIVGDDVELEVLRHDEGPADADMSFFGELASVLRELDPQGVPVPMLLPAVTDARHLSPIGIQTCASCRSSCRPTSRSARSRTQPTSACRPTPCASARGRLPRASSGIPIRLLVLGGTRFLGRAYRRCTAGRPR